MQPFPPCSHSHHVLPFGMAFQALWSSGQLSEHSSDIEKSCPATHLNGFLSFIVSGKEKKVIEFQGCWRGGGVIIKHGLFLTLYFINST